MSRVAAEIEVDLEGVGRHAEPGVQAAGGEAAKTASATWPTGLASSTFLAKPRMKSATPEANRGHACARGRQLVGQRVVADDRPGHQVGEQGDEARKSVNERAGWAVPR